MIAAALMALPVIAEVGQGLINTIGKDMASFFGASPAGRTGQNVPASANHAPPNLTGAAQALSSDMLSVLTAAQTSLGNVASFASGQTSVSKPQLESMAASAAGVLGQNPTDAKAAADKAFDAIDTGHTGQINQSQLAGYLGQAQSQVTSKYQAASKLVDTFAQQFSGLMNSSPGISV